tara:strand:- start:299 stop:475 length:177 start_codon:yes stop_codon:yes gene_type:complete
MDTQRELQSVRRDNRIIDLIGGLQNNVQGLKDIIDLLLTRIERLEKGKNESTKNNRGI